MRFGADGIVLEPNFEFATETPRRTYYNNERLLVNGDCWERTSAKGEKRSHPRATKQVCE